MSVRHDFLETEGWFIGEDKSIVITIKDAAEVPIDITGWTIQFKVANAISGTALFTKTATLTTPASGICTVTVASADTISLPPSEIGETEGTPSQYTYALRRTDVNNKAELMYGYIEFLAVYASYT